MTCCYSAETPSIQLWSHPEDRTKKRKEKRKHNNFPSLLGKTSLFSSSSRQLAKAAFKGQISTYERNPRAITGLDVGSFFFCPRHNNPASSLSSKSSASCCTVASPRTPWPTFFLSDRSRHLSLSLAAFMSAHRAAAAAAIQMGPLERSQDVGGIKAVF